MKNLIFFVVFLFVGCVQKLELAPDIAGEITAFEVVGQVRSTINPAQRTVLVEVAEGTNLAAVKIARISLNETATADVAAGEIVDLREPLTVTVTTIAEYEWTVRASVATGGERALPGGSFDDWSRSTPFGVADDKGRTYNPWPAGASLVGVDRWWDTGNRGVTIIHDSNSTPTEPGEGAPTNPNGRAARLESVWALMKVAGGNIYFGSFGELTGFDATCLMGHPWRGKPQSLKGWYKYFPQPVDRVGGDEYLAHHPYKIAREEWMGSPDSLSVIVALWASPDGADVPFEVNTSPDAYVDFLPTTPGIVAWGQMVSADEQVEWSEFEVPLEYRVSGDLPAGTRLLVQITSSKNCNYFIAGTSGGGADGKTGSLMMVDELELEY